MNTTKSWFQKARAQTFRTNRRDRGNNRRSSETRITTSDADRSNEQNDKNGQTGVPAVERPLTQILFKSATIRGPAMMPEVVNAYNLDWWELEPFLKRVYPGVPFKENLAVDDHYQIYVPRLLSKDEKDRIQEIRKQHRDRERSATGRGQTRERVEHSPDGPRRLKEDDDD